MRHCWRLLKQKFLFTPLNLLDVEIAFATWPMFTFCCAFIFPFCCNRDVLIDGACYTYAIGVLTPLIFDRLIAAVVAKRNNNNENFTQLKFYYELFAFLIVFFSCAAYSSGIKTWAFFQLIMFCSASLIAYLFYLCMHMSDFPDLVLRYDDEPYQVAENENIDKLKDTENYDELRDNDGIKI